MIICPNSVDYHEHLLKKKLFISTPPYENWSYQNNSALLSVTVTLAYILSIVMPRRRIPPPPLSGHHPRLYTFPPKSINKIF